MTYVSIINQVAFDNNDLETNNPAGDHIFSMCSYNNLCQMKRSLFSICVYVYCVLFGVCVFCLSFVVISYTLALLVAQLFLY